MRLDYDIGIAGGGLAGLTTAIQLRKKGYSVILFEKKTYPFSRVCGEYISNESRNYLISCGIDIPALQLPEIKKLLVSAPNGNLLKADLDMGGFGISRYKLDNMLYQQAVALGVDVMTNTTVTDLLSGNNGIQFLPTSKGTYRVKMAVGAFGKRSKIDVLWHRDFVINKPNALNNFIGVKYHIQTDFPEDTIALHNFKDGYCGISKVEENKYCLCYLTTAANLQQSGGIRAMERSVLYQNKHLKKIFENSIYIFKNPVSVSQISFDNKETVYRNTPLIGDAAGMITPLCGNGMSMAMHGGKLLTEAINTYLKSNISYDEMLKRYEAEWNTRFAARLKTGRWIQKRFGKSWQTNLFIGLLKHNNWLMQKLIQQTHGDVF